MVRKIATRLSGTTGANQPITPRELNLAVPAASPVDRLTAGDELTAVPPSWPARPAESAHAARRSAWSHPVPARPAGSPAPAGVEPSSHRPPSAAATDRLRSRGCEPRFRLG